MQTSDITDPVFLEAVLSIDSGDKVGLEKMLTANPRLVQERLSTPGEQGYFNDPYLLWFVAGNPVRHEKLPASIVEIAELLIGYIKRDAPDSFQLQVDHTLELVATGRIPKECGVQIPLIDLLISCGAAPCEVMGAIGHNNLGAARHLLKNGARLNLAAAVCLDMPAELEQLALNASRHDRQLALVSAAFFGKAEAVQFMLEQGADPNAYLDPAKAQGFHSHATALHQAVVSGSFETVKALVEGGANLNLTDRIYHGTPMGWAEHALEGASDNKSARFRYQKIAQYLSKQTERNP